MILDDFALRAEPMRSTGAPVVVLEGADSAPEFHAVLDLRVLLDVATVVRRRRLLEREGEQTRCSGAEDHYFASVMPSDRFDLILGGGHVDEPLR